MNRGVAVYKNRLYLATLDAHVVALDNQTGKVIWDKKIGDYTYAETFTVMPLVVNNKVIFGTAGAEYGVRGWVAAIDADTGAPAWKTYTIPAQESQGTIHGLVSLGSMVVVLLGLLEPMTQQTIHFIGELETQDQTLIVTFV